MPEKVSLNDGPREKLNDLNWPKWKQSIEAFLFLKGCDQWLRTPLPVDASDEDRLVAKQATSWILLCVSERWARRIRELDSPFEMWQMFEEKYRDTLRPRSVTLQKKLFASRQTANQSTDEYIDAIQMMNDDLHELGAGLSEATLINHVISSLGPSFKASKGPLRMQASTFDLDTLRYALNSIDDEEDQSAFGAQQSKALRHSRQMSSANKGDSRQPSRNWDGSECSGAEDSGQAGTSNPFSRKICNHCGQQGHIAPFCELKCQKKCPDQPMAYAPGYPRVLERCYFCSVVCHKALQISSHPEVHLFSLTCGCFACPTC